MFKSFRFFTVLCPVSLIYGNSCPFLLLLCDHLLKHSSKAGTEHGNPSTACQICPKNPKWLSTDKRICKRMQYELLDIWPSLEMITFFQLVSVFPISQENVLPSQLSASLVKEWIPGTLCSRNLHSPFYLATHMNGRVSITGWTSCLCHSPILVLLRTWKNRATTLAAPAG